MPVKDKSKNKKRKLCWIVKLHIFLNIQKRNGDASLKKKYAYHLAEPGAVSPHY